MPTVHDLSRGEQGGAAARHLACSFADVSSRCTNRCRDSGPTCSMPLATSRSARACASGEISGPTSVSAAAPGPTLSAFARATSASFQGSMPPTNTAAETAMHLRRSNTLLSSAHPAPQALCM